MVLRESYDLDTTNKGKNLLINRGGPNYMMPNSKSVA